MFFQWAMAWGPELFDPSPYRASQNRTTLNGQKMALRLGLPRERARSETREKSGAGEMGNGSRSEVRGSRNFEPRTSNVVSLLPCKEKK